MANLESRANVQTQVLAANIAHATFYSFNLRAQADIKKCLRVIADFFDGESMVLGIGYDVVNMLGKHIPGLSSARVFQGPLRSNPVLQHDFWLRVNAIDPGQCMLKSQAMLDALSPHCILVEQVDGYMHREGRDLSGYVDGTENPEDRARSVVMVDKQQPGVYGSTFLAVQKWHHQLSVLKAKTQTEQDHVIGRRESDNLELDDAPKSAHVKRTAQEQFSPEAFMLRRSLPWSEGRDCGLNFVCFANSFYPFEAQLQRMMGCDDGIEDGLYQFSRPVNGSYYWCPAQIDGQLDLSALI
ncbi:Dyp-type peroxidase [Alginatibacterium sediminis]|uniref:Dyp-type peroxidase n=1 Tax=Alginatibacterium sediminis TaxID=2164068 RepID=A0A420EAT5_9ALTE|nr:Dyp-type peroxidase [Alginatibacterium sediminis]RKF17764.1 Dyp-type peroxidase [Alginatibacterium sediminis]